MKSNVMLHDSACPFRLRCPLVIDGLCDTQPPPLRMLTGTHGVYCQHDAPALREAQDHP